MADDDDDDMTMEPEEDFEVEVDEEEIDPDELDEEDLEEDPDLVEGDEFEETFGGEDEEEEDDTSGPVRARTVSEDEDEDEDLVNEDDVEADLDTILKDRLVAAEDEDDEEEDEEPEERGEASDRLQPKRADEQSCSKCFLLVRQSAPVCPMGDDECPLFS